MNIYQGHEFVDLGLPSGTLWAICNVGANTPEDYGDYYSWDECKTAAANWGDGWCTPSNEQWKELMHCTKQTWTTRNGVNGRLFTALNGNSLFLPAAGRRWDEKLHDAGSVGNYWTSSPNPGRPCSARDIYFDSENYDMGASGREGGFTVRPVRSSLQN